MAKQGNGQRGNDADQHSKEQTAKHDLYVRISMKTLHQTSFSFFPYP